MAITNRRLRQSRPFGLILFIGSVALLAFSALTAQAQLSTPDHADTSEQERVKDVGDILRSLLKKSAPKKEESPSSVAFLPSLGYNPSFGFVIGGKVTAGRQYGDAATTAYSVFGLEALYTSKSILTAQARHNIFTTGNQWNFQGHWQLARFGLVDYGIGTGKNTSRENRFIINEFPLQNGEGAFPIRFTYIRLTEKLYRKIGAHTYMGGGVSMDIRAQIADEKQAAGLETPHYLYSLKNGFNPTRYSANGLLLAFQYNTREHPIRAYDGIYADFALRVNQRWLGSTKNAVQLVYDFRKYWSLSQQNPEHVLAFWHWASYRLSGTLPYLELPATGYDTYARSGRAYTIGNFKGLSYGYFETEYRFPITRNKLLSGVCFVNAQSASEDDVNLFRFWKTGAGVGLRVLFQKQSRTTLCIDFAQGNNGAKGFFFGLGEVF
ncbi:BamA/TamA family outer membrane protein [Spirosoma montaniterrae]|uniref:Bacterial surface antigen (D15) domain-containing protein n=1 Tax=Spirosoma montaniterrae TaxID=1178516 RepID=A0A1P9X273_9BACT|nr:BamA/TamA family outer membrane protein [Spirosoma montaniterrae]AQG81732.1 hypothetical protein AWR27_21965 [Spirosoma montaniterrae]